MISISVIIPIYNREKTIGRCLESVLNQSFTDFECLLVDDGSNDGSYAICEQYAKKDSRIKLFHKQNAGVSSARNFGLDKAKGDWIIFVDSDDFILPNHFANYYSGVSQDVDVVFSGFETKDDPSALNHSYDDGIYVGNEGITKFLSETDALLFMPICDKMYRRSVVEEHRLIFDSSISLSEDRLFECQFLQFAQGVATISGKTYIIDSADVNSLTQRRLSSIENSLRYHKLSKILQSLLRTFNLDGYSKRLVKNYMESLYSDLINSYKNEGMYFAYYKTRLLHKLNLL